MLDLLTAYPRVEIRGGAGSGKTWLAVEKARRLAAEGQRVALMCYSRGLAEFLKRRVEKPPKRQRPAYVGTFHNLGIDWGVPAGSDDDSRYWEEFLPAEMVKLARALPEEQRFDAIVIDEGQDFAQSWWDAVVAALREPDHGCLYVFSDEGQRIFARQGRPTVELMPIPLEREPAQHQADRRHLLQPRAGADAHPRAAPACPCGSSSAPPTRRSAPRTTLPTRCWRRAGRRKPWHC